MDECSKETLPKMLCFGPPTLKIVLPTLYNQDKIRQSHITYSSSRPFLALIQNGRIERLAISSLKVSEQEAAFCVFYVGSHAFFNVSCKTAWLDKSYGTLWIYAQSLDFKSLAARFWVSLIDSSLQFLTHCNPIIGGHCPLSRALPSILRKLAL